MLATQLCVFDDKTDSESKWVKTVIIIWLCFLNYLVYFVKISICDALLQFNDHANGMCHTLTQGIRKNKTFTKYTKYYCWWIYHQRQKQEQEACRMLRSLW